MILTFLLTWLMSFGQSVEKTDSTLTFDTSKTVIVNAEYAKKPVRSMCRTGVGVIDTLNTLNDCIKVVLYADNTWQYVKMPGYVQESDLFKQHWDTVNSNPYKKSQADLPNTWAIWLVDSLEMYHCPYQGSVYYKYGVRRGRPHQGVDLPLTTGTPVHAAFNGQVRVSRYTKGYGNLVIVRHENGLETFYGHLSERKVEVGEWVNAGHIIGLGGSTGRSTGPHLHFETRYQGFSFDPQWLIDFKTGELRHLLVVLKQKDVIQDSAYEQDFEAELFNEEEDLKEAAEREAMRWHIVRSGDTLYGLALANKTTVSAICRWNGISESSTLRIGQKLRVR